MTEIGLFYGSTNGTTAIIAEKIQQQFASKFNQPVELIDVAEFLLEEMLDFEWIIVGIPTWNQGQLQRDWESVFEEFDSLDLSGKTVALFGVGDQVGYPTTFADALFFIADKMRSQGARLIGRWPIDGYQFTGSWALEEGTFLGLVLDEENQSTLSDARIVAWVDQLMNEFKLPFSLSA